MFDFLIIGGGIAGLSAGAHLAKSARVCVVESEPSLGYHSSSRSAAVLIPTYGTHAVNELSRASRDPFQSLGVLSERGGMVVGQADEDQAFAQAMAGFEMEEITVADAVSRVPLLDPAKITRAAATDQAWDIDTDLLLQTYAKQIRANGEVRTKAPVTAITRADQGHWRVTAGGEDIDAGAIVNAAGAWADEVAKLAGITPIGITPKRRSMARIEVPGGFDPTGWPMIFGARDDWYAKPDAGALIVSPSEADPVAPQDAWADDMVLAEGLARFEERMSHEVTRMIANWAGLRSFTPDGDLAIGVEPGVAGFYWMVGQGGYGFQTGPAAGRLLADLAFKQAPEMENAVIAACDPARFR